MIDDKDGFDLLKPVDKRHYTGFIYKCCCLEIFADLRSYHQEFIITGVLLL